LGNVKIILDTIKTIRQSKYIKNKTEQHKMQAIQIKYLGPTDTRGSRYKAICAGGSYTHHRDYAQGEDGNALTAAELLVDKMGWDGIEITGMGTLPNGDYVCTTEFVEVAA